MYRVYGIKPKKENCTPLFIFFIFFIFFNYLLINELHKEDTNYYLLFIPFYLLFIRKKEEQHPNFSPFPLFFSSKR